jgi:hypothetical protein
MYLNEKKSTEVFIKLNYVSTKYVIKMFGSCWDA